MAFRVGVGESDFADLADEGCIDNGDKEIFAKLKSGSANKANVKNSLKFIMRFLRHSPNTCASARAGLIARGKKGQESIHQSLETPCSRIGGFSLLLCA